MLGARKDMKDSIPVFDKEKWDGKIQKYPKDEPKHIVKGSCTFSEKKYDSIEDIKRNVDSNKWQKNANYIQEGKAELMDDYLSKNKMHMKETGKKNDDGKPQWDLLYYPAFESLVRVMMMGRDKYGFENWKKPFDLRRLRNAMMRHLVADLNGEYMDKESHEPHITHVMANCMMIFYHELKAECDILGDFYTNIPDIEKVPEWIDCKKSDFCLECDGHSGECA